MPPLEALTPWQQRVLNLTRHIPRGKVTTYQVLARRSGRPRAARAVGNVLHINPDMAHIPCHRVVKSDGSIGGYANGSSQKFKKLQSEGVKFISPTKVSPSSFYG